MKHIKTYEDNIQFKYDLGDYVLIPDPINNSYTLITQIKNSYIGDYIVTTYDILTDNILEEFPIYKNEIIRKLTPEEITEININKSTEKYNL